MREIFIERLDKIVRIAVREEEKLEEFLIEEDTEIYPGQIYKGVIKNIVPAIKCAFVDIGEAKSGYLYMDSRLKNLSLKRGEELLVEIVKESAGTKGPRVSNAITVPGRYAVITTMNNEIEISKKINDVKYINELKANIRKPEDTGVMIRTNALKVSFESINHEIEYLHKIYENIMTKSKALNKRGMVYDAGGAIGRVLRDNLDENTKRIVVNSKSDLDYIIAYVENKEDINCTVEMHENVINLMEYYGIEKSIFDLTKRRVLLECGGYIVIDKTEAMYVIDVNSGKNVKGSSIGNTANITNVEAAKEIVRQIKLRNLSGIIVIDFIDNDDERSRKRIIDILEGGFKDDKNKTIVYPFTELNLVQIARRRRGRSLSEYLEEDCFYCSGSGKQFKLLYMKNIIKNKVIRILSQHEGKKNIYIEMDKRYESEILKNVEAFSEEIGVGDGSLYINFKEKMNLPKVELVVFQDKLEQLSEFKIYG